MPTIYASSVSSAIKSKSKFNFLLNYKKWLNKKKPTFGDLTKVLYFSHGNLFEKYAIIECRKIIDKMYNGLTFIPQAESERELDIFEKEYARMYLKYNAHRNFSFLETKGVKNETYQNGYTVSARPDGLFDNHILEVKCPLGQLYKVKGSGQTENGFDYSKEQFIIPFQYKLQMIIEMLCHGKSKGFFFQYYEPNGWKSFFHHIHYQYWNVDKLEVGDRVYKPWVNHDDPVFTVLLRGYKINTSIWKYYQELSSIPNIILKTNGKVDMTQKESFEQYRDKMEYILNNININRMVELGFTRQQAEEIKTKLQVGSGLKAGFVYKNKMKLYIDWGNDLELVNYKDYQLGIIHIMKTIYIPRKNLYKWKAFRQNLDNNLMTPTFPEYISPIEHVLIEFDMSEYIKVIQFGNARPAIQTRGLDIVHTFLKEYDNPNSLENLWKMVKPLKKFLEQLPIKVLNTYRGQSQTQKDLEFIKDFIKKNPEKYTELKDYIRGKSKETLISVDTLKNLFNMEQKQNMNIGYIDWLLKKIENESQVNSVLKKINSMKLKF